MSKYVVDIHGDIEGDYNIIKKYEEPKTAHWTNDFICSNCGCKCYPIDIDFGDYNYCPNCGTKMIGGEE